MIKKNLEWYAFIQDFNGNKLRYINVIDDELIESVKKCNTYEEVKKEIRLELMHHYWSRSEYEVVVTNWCGKEMEQKIDVWYQIEPNLDRLTEYMIRNIKKLNGKINI